MCGIFACHKCFKPITEFKATALQLSKGIRHRGPDWSGNVIKNNTILCHERLAIVGVGMFSLGVFDVDSGAQPITNSDSTLILAVNGEIYNHRALRKGLKKLHTFKTHSDCEVILHLVCPPEILMVVRRTGSRLLLRVGWIFQFCIARCPRWTRQNHRGTRSHRCNHIIPRMGFKFPRQRLLCFRSEMSPGRMR
jgi:hypothetical protein